jgi:hypothetical protein
VQEDQKNVETTATTSTSIERVTTAAANDDDIAKTETSIAVDAPLDTTEKIQEDADSLSALAAMDSQVAETNVDDTQASTKDDDVSEKFDNSLAVVSVDMSTEAISDNQEDMIADASIDESEAATATAGDENEATDVTENTDIAATDAGNANEASDATSAQEITEPAPTTAAADDTSPPVTMLLTFSCRDLPKNDRFSKSDPVLALYAKNAEGTYSYVGQTESMKDTHDPDFATAITVEVASGAEYKVCAYDVDDNDQIQQDDLLGSVVVAASDLNVDASEGCEYDLTDKDGSPANSKKDMRARVSVTCRLSGGDSVEVAAAAADTDVDATAALDRKAMMAKLKASKKDKKKKNKKKKKDKQETVDDATEGDDE